MPIAARSVEASSSSPCARSGEAVQQTRLTRGRTRRSPPVASHMRRTASTCQRPSSSCWTCLRVCWSTTASSAIMRPSSDRSVAATIGQTMSAEPIASGPGRVDEVLRRAGAPLAGVHVKRLGRRTGIAEVRRSLVEDTVVGGREAAEDDAPRALREGVAHEIGGHAGDSHFPIDGRPGLGEGVEGVAGPEAHTDPLKQAQSLLHNQRPFGRRGPLHLSAHLPLLVAVASLFMPYHRRLGRGSSSAATPPVGRVRRLASPSVSLVAMAARAASWSAARSKSSARWHAMSRPFRSTYSGTSLSQTARRNLQRGWKRQPAGGSMALGTSPVGEHRPSGVRGPATARSRAAPTCTDGAGRRRAPGSSRSPRSGPGT